MTSQSQPAGDDARIAVVKRWNALLAARNSEGLRSIYAAYVKFYGVNRSRDAVLAAKAAAFAKSPDYTQAIGPITLASARTRHWPAR